MMISWQDMHGIDTTCPIWQDAVWNLLLKHIDCNEEMLVHCIGVEIENISKQQERQRLARIKVEMKNISKQQER